MARGKKVCPNCKSENAARLLICFSCQHVFKIVEKEVPEKGKKRGKKGESSEAKGKQGKKICPKCQAEYGARKIECSTENCGHIFIAGGKKEAVPKKKKVVAEKTTETEGTTPPAKGKQGKKVCPKCQSEYGARKTQCVCGHMFPIKATPTVETPVETPSATVDQSAVESISSTGEEGPVKPLVSDITSVVESPPVVTNPSNIEPPFVVSPIAVETKETIVKKVIKKTVHIDIEQVTREIHSDDVLTTKGYITPKMTPLQHAERILGYGPEKAARIYHLHELVSSWGHVDWNHVKEMLPDDVSFDLNNDIDAEEIK